MICNQNELYRKQTLYFPIHLFIDMQHACVHVGATHKDFVFIALKVKEFYSYKNLQI